MCRFNPSMLWCLALTILCGPDLAACHQHWDNGLKQSLNVSCSPGAYINQLSSLFEHPDRRWDFSCRAGDDIVEDFPASSQQTCSMHGDVNQYDQRLDFQCPDGSAIAGVSSVFNEHHKDRTWSYRCCKPADGCHTQHLHTTPCLNGGKYQAPISWTVPTHRFLVGFRSYHSNQYEDRKWRAKYAELDCPATKCQCTTDMDPEEWDIVEGPSYHTAQATIVTGDPVVLEEMPFPHPGEEEGEINYPYMPTPSVSETFQFRDDADGAGLRQGAPVMVAVPRLSNTRQLEDAGDPLLNTLWGQRRTRSRTTDPGEMTISVRKGETITAKVIIDKAEVRVPYTLTLEHKTLGCQCEGRGTLEASLGYNPRIITARADTPIERRSRLSSLMKRLQWNY